MATSASNKKTATKLVKAYKAPASKVSAAKPAARKIKNVPKAMPSTAVLSDAQEKDIHQYLEVLNNLSGAKTEILKKMLLRNYHNCVFEDEASFGNDCKSDDAYKKYQKLAVKITNQLPDIVDEFVKRKIALPNIYVDHHAIGLSDNEHHSQSLEGYLLKKQKSSYLKLLKNGLIPYAQWPYADRNHSFSAEVPTIKGFKKPISYIYQMLCERFMGVSVSHYRYRNPYSGYQSSTPETLTRIHSWIEHSPTLMSQAAKAAQLAIEVMESKQLKPSSALLEGLPSAKDTLAKELALFIGPAAAKQKVNDICVSIKKDQAQYVDRTPWFATLFCAISQQSETVLKTILPTAIAAYPELTHSSFYNKSDGDISLELNRFQGQGLIEYAIETHSFHCLGTLMTQMGRIPEDTSVSKVKPACKDLITPFLKAALAAERSKDATVPSFELFSVLRALTAKELTEHYGYSFEEAIDWIEKKVVALMSSKKTPASKAPVERWVLEHSIKPLKESDLSELKSFKEELPQLSLATSKGSAFPVSLEEANSKRRAERSSVPNAKRVRL